MGRRGAVPVEGPRQDEIGVFATLLARLGPGLVDHVRELALEFPSAAEKVSHGRPAFFTKKVFAYYGGSLKVDERWVEHPRSLVVQPDPDDRPALVEDPRVYVPAYLGPSGWRGIDLHGRTDWGEVAELLDASFRLTPQRRKIAELDARS